MIYLDAGAEGFYSIFKLIWGPLVFEAKEWHTHVHDMYGYVFMFEKVKMVKVYS